MLTVIVLTCGPSMSASSTPVTVTFWGVSDKYSWLNNYPVRGRTAYPLLFDRNFKPKPAYHVLKELADEKLQ